MMRQKKLKTIVLILLVMLNIIVFSWIPIYPAQASAVLFKSIQPYCNSELLVPVIVELKPVCLIDHPFLQQSKYFQQSNEPNQSNYISHLLRQVVLSQKNWIKNLRKKPISFMSLSSCQYVGNYLFMYVKGTHLPMLAKDNSVKSIFLDHEIKMLRNTMSITTGAERIWDGSYTNKARGTGIKIGIVDSGIDANHVEFLNKIKKGIDFTNDNNYRLDGVGHGTHVAGIAAGLGSTEYGKGMAYQSDLYVYKVFSKEGKPTSDSKLLEALDNAVADRCDVVNMSLGSAGESEGRDENPYYDVMKRMAKANVMVVAAIGNSGTNGVKNPWPGSTPGIVEDVFCVGATDDRKYTNGITIADFSSVGMTADGLFKPEIAAPGVKIMSTYLKKQGGYASGSGTSMSSPSVAGLVALIKSAKPRWSIQQIKSSLMNNAAIIMNEKNNEPITFSLQGAGQARVDKAIMTEAFLNPQAFVVEQTASISKEVSIENANETDLVISSIQAEVYGLHTEDAIKITLPQEDIVLGAYQSKKIRIQFDLHRELFIRSKYEGIIWINQMHIPFVIYKESVEAHNKNVIHHPVSDLYIEKERVNKADQGDTNRIEFSFNTGKMTVHDDLVQYSNFGKIQIYLCTNEGEKISNKPLYELDRCSIGTYSFSWDYQKTIQEYSLDYGSYRLMVSLPESDSYETSDLSFSIVENPFVRIHMNAKCLTNGIELTWDSNTLAKSGYNVYKKLSSDEAYPAMPLFDFPIIENRYVVTKGLVIGESYQFICKPVGLDLKEIPSIQSEEVQIIYKPIETTMNVQFQIGEKTAWLNDKPILLDVAPEMKEYRLFVPIRALSDVIGAKVEYEESEQKITILYFIQSQNITQTIEFWIGKPTAYINGKPQLIDPYNETLSPYGVNERTMLPMRFIGIALLAKKTLWDAVKQKATFVFFR